MGLAIGFLPHRCERIRKPELTDNLAATLNYRYLGTAGDQGFRITSFATPQVFYLTTDLSSHNITVGLRYTFAKGGGGS